MFFYEKEMVEVKVLPSKSQPQQKKDVLYLRRNRKYKNSPTRASHHSHTSDNRKITIKRYLIIPESKPFHLTLIQQTCTLSKVTLQAPTF